MTSAPTTAPQSHTKDLTPSRDCPFPIGIEYYRAPAPPTRFWDEDFARIKAAGMSIVRSFSPWNWIEPSPGDFRFDDFALMFELADKHGLKVWLDTPVGTHMACPEWITQKHPDMRAVWADGSVQMPTAGSATPLGTMIHNFDHPMWRVYVERFIRAIVPRYAQHPAMLVWGTWDGINFAAAWAREGQQELPPYNDYTIDKYRSWLKERFTLDELNDHLMRRFPTWEAVEPARHPDALMDMLLYRRFHFENMADHLGWLADLIDRLDGKHEQRSHGASFPKASDEVCAASIDGWGLSHHSADRLTGDDPYGLTCECFGFQWSRAIGRGGRWWNEEIYSSFVGGLAPHEKRTIPEESTLFLWLSLVEGSAGALYWQYRPEYLTFEGPGLALVSLDGEPTPRWSAVGEAIGQINSIADHLPLSIPRAALAIGYSGLSHEIFSFQGGDTGAAFLDQLRGLFRTLWKHSVPMDIVTPAMDWSAYDAVYLPNFAVLDDAAIGRLRESLEDPNGPVVIADGHLGTFSGAGRWSYRPPEGIDDLINARVSDFDVIKERDVVGGRNVLQTPHGAFAVPAGTSFAILEPRGDVQPIATLNGQVVGVSCPRGRWTWYGVSLATTDHSPLPGQPLTGRQGAGVVHEDIALPMVSAHGIKAPADLDGDRLVVFKRQSRMGGTLLFAMNLAVTTARTRVRPAWEFSGATDLLNGESELRVQDGGFDLEVPFGDVRVILMR